MPYNHVVQVLIFLPKLCVDGLFNSYLILDKMFSVFLLVYLSTALVLTPLGS